LVRIYGRWTLTGEFVAVFGAFDGFGEEPTEGGAQHVQTLHVVSQLHGHLGDGRVGATVICDHVALQIQLLQSDAVQ